VAAVVIGVLIYAPLAVASVACDISCQLPWFTQTVFAVVAGLAIRERTRLGVDLETQADLLRRTREEGVRLAVVEERLRLAREVHDLVAHGVTLMVIKAGAARWTVPSDPVQADGTLRSIDDEGRTALRELQSLLGTLGGPPGDDGRVPIHSQRSLRSVVQAARNDGLEVELSTSGDERDLTGGLKLSLIRIVQESLTNVSKHAPGARVSVEIRYLPDGIELDIVNGPATSALPLAAVRGPGHGLIGIAERAALHTGWAQSGSTPDGGFHVTAFLAQERVPV
jgi:signal transduction histidine kinase